MDAMKFDWMVVGAGFTGASFAERMAVAGKTVLVIDGRSHIGGNAYDSMNEHGILVHRYGPHIFHTNSDAVFSYLSMFTGWRPYEHRVLGEINGRLVPIPFNLSSLAELFNSAEADRIRKLLINAYGIDKKVPILTLRESVDVEIRDFAAFVYENVFERYTRKQWALGPEELSPSVTARVPVLIGYDDRYFQDKHQAMPLQGYTALFTRMLNHPNITVELNCHSSQVKGSAERTLFTGAVDELLNYRFGPLPYRSIRFEEFTLAVPRHQAVGTVNYPNEHAYTRITEQKIITGQSSDVTTLMKEYPIAHIPGETVAYYPIPRDENQNLYARYAEAAKAEFPEVVFAGRLGDYQYYNMDQACARGIKLAADHGAGSWPPSAESHSSAPKSPALG
jgi:UDP-galactopyranose mutase